MIYSLLNNISDIILCSMNMKKMRIFINCLIPNEILLSYPVKINKKYNELYTQINKRK